MSKQRTRISQALDHFMQRIRSQTHLTSLSTEEAIRRICILSQLQCLQQYTMQTSTFSSQSGGIQVCKLQHHSQTSTSVIVQGTFSVAPDFFITKHFKCEILPDGCSIHLGESVYKLYLLPKR